MILMLLLQITISCKDRQKPPSVQGDNAATTNEPARQSPWLSTREQLTAMLSKQDKAGLLGYFHDEVQVAHVMSLEMFSKVTDSAKFLSGDTVASTVLFDDEKIKKLVGAHLVSFRTAFAKGKHLPDKQEGEAMSLLSDYGGYTYSLNAICDSTKCKLNQITIYNSDPQKAAAADSGPY